MKKLLIIFASLLISSVAIAADTFTGKCLLEVENTKYINGPCEITMGKGGTFQISTLKKGGYFAQVMIDDDGAEGHWNGEPGAGHAHERLGALKQKGGCWQNSTAKVCAWR